MGKPKVVLYTRDGCHLCDEMKKVVEAVAVSTPLELSEVDIDTDADLRRLYDWEVPVLEVNGRKAFKYQVSERELRQRLRNADDRN